MPGWRYKSVGCGAETSPVARIQRAQIDLGRARPVGGARPRCGTRSTLTRNRSPYTLLPTDGWSAPANRENRYRAQEARFQRSGPDSGPGIRYLILGPPLCPYGIAYRMAYGFLIVIIVFLSLGSGLGARPRSGASGPCIALPPLPSAIRKLLATHFLAQRATRSRPKRSILNAGLLSVYQPRAGLVTLLKDA